MTLRLREVTLGLDEGEEHLPGKVARELGLPPEAVWGVRVVRRGIDARKKPLIRLVFTLELEAEDEAEVLARNKANRRLCLAEPPEALGPLVIEGYEAPGGGAAPPEALPMAGSSVRSCALRPRRVVVVGMGPAGLFAALRLGRAGARVTLLERGRPVEERSQDVARFWAGEGLDPESNMQFGEGGAGTFSDGKLTTRIHHGGVRHVLRTLVACGAPERILSDATPHLGTDKLRLVLGGMRRALVDAGVELRFSTKLTSFEMGPLAATEGMVQAAPRIAVRAAVVDNREEIPCDGLVMACGHSARDTYAMLHDRGVALARKAFAMGVRVEHPAAMIHRIQYGRGPHPRLPAAQYALSWIDRDSGRAVYSFCMCPGGQVVIASSEVGGLVTNGMSNSKRDGERSNAALVVAVREEDFGAQDPLAGVRFQRQWEEVAFAAGGGGYRAPAQNLLAFLRVGTGPVEASCRPGVREADLCEVLPSFVSEGLRRALPRFAGKLRGFVTSEAVLVGVESRTSAPVRILRGEDGQSVSHPGLFPAGEGAGYSGGIVSSAVDGLRAAEHLAASLRLL